MITSITSVWNGEIVKSQMKKAVGDSLFKVALIVESYAKKLCARRYGYLAASINTQTKSEGTKVEDPGKYRKETPPPYHNVLSFKEIAKPTEDNMAYVGTHVDYNYHVEYGTVKMDAQPFLRPALEYAKGEVLDIVKIGSKSYLKDYLIEHIGYLGKRGVV